MKFDELVRAIHQYDDNTAPAELALDRPIDVAHHEAIRSRMRLDALKRVKMRVA